jgi:hypothetical protein
LSGNFIWCRDYWNGRRVSVPERAANTFAFWTAAKRADAIPRDFVVDQRGFGYLRKSDGTLVPHGHGVAALAKSKVVPRGKPDGVGGGNGGGKDDGNDGGGKTKVVRSADWRNGGTVQNAAGRLLFSMNGSYYVCSGTVVNDVESGRSVILTAAHCVYDDVNKAFATQVMFIPNQDATSGSATDFDCSNDPIGCWVPSFGVVDVNWTTAVFPNNIPWDYAYYVVPDSGAHQGSGNEAALDVAAPPMDISFTSATLGIKTHALGYSYSEDPSFMYCAQDVSIEGGYNDLWLSSCKLSGGASGGPWSQSTERDLGIGPVISINSWGYTGQPGMAGLPLSGNTAECLFDRAKTSSLLTLGLVGC